MRRIGKAAKVVISHLPVVVIKEPERVTFGLTGIILGIMVFISPLQPPSIVEVTNDNLSVYSWGLTFLVGGVSKLAGLRITTDTYGRITVARYNRGRYLERFGALLLMMAFVTYGVAILLVNGTNGLFVAVVFFLGALGNLLRLVVSTAGRESLKERGFGNGSL